MSNEINTGGPAFPVTRLEAGMTLRDYFAANAPVTCIDANQSLLQRPEATRFADCDDDGALPLPLIIKELARLRWEYADAMMAARDGEE